MKYMEMENRIQIQNDPKSILFFYFIIKHIGILNLKAYFVSFTVTST